jgi:predicted NAD/FAD-binding protein
MIDRKGQRSRLTCSTLPPPLHLLAGVLEWTPCRGATACRRSNGRAAEARQARLQPGSSTIAASPGEMVENWLIRNGQTSRIREMLWEPLALAALNQPPRQAAAPAFARVLGEMFGDDPRAAAIALPTKPLHLMYAEPARAYIEKHGGAVRTGASAKVRVQGDAVASVQGPQPEEDPRPGAGVDVPGDDGGADCARPRLPVSSSGRAAWSRRRS